MDLATSAVWLPIAIIFITFVAKFSRGENTLNPRTPPLVNGISLLPSVFVKGLPCVMQDLYTKFGSVCTISFFGPKITLLIGPEVSAHFFQGLQSEISYGNLLEFTIPMFGQEVGYAVDTITHTEQMHFHIDALKLAKLRNYFNPMVEEVEAYFAKWGHDGIVDLKHELEQVIFLVSSRCLLGDDIREKMLDEVYPLFRELENSTSFINFFFPYIPTPANRRRDKAHSKLKEILCATIRSRKSSPRVKEDILQGFIDCRYKDGRPTTEAEVSGLIMSLIYAGNHSSSHTTIWTGAELLSNAKCLTDVVEEQNLIALKYKDRADYDALMEMDTLHRCIKEALRIHSSTPMVLRKAHKKFTVRTREGREYDIPGGHTLASPTIINSNLPYIYKDPLVYDPDRFGPGREEDKAGGAFSYTSFGGGRHVCPGMSFAFMQIKVIWSHLLRNFELKLISPFPKADWSKFILEPKGKVMVSYKRHQQPCCD